MMKIGLQLLAGLGLSNLLDFFDSDPVQQTDSSTLAGAVESIIKLVLVGFAGVFAYLFFIKWKKK